MYGPGSGIHRWHKQYCYKLQFSQVSKIGRQISGKIPSCWHFLISFQQIEIHSGSLGIIYQNFWTGILGCMLGWGVNSFIFFLHSSIFHMASTSTSLLPHSFVWEAAWCWKEAKTWKMVKWGRIEVLKILLLFQAVCDNTYLCACVWTIY